MSAGKAAKKRGKPKSEHSFYPAWCKRCGNCVAFCPRGILVADEWGYPRQQNPERCTACGLCEMLCPDFAITVGYEKPGAMDMTQAAGGESKDFETPKPGSSGSSSISPERLAPAPREEK
ncbi:MAG: ferredoxin family protein [Proteobacteria bacterium]|nr:ferredoxin family protein [Pseudomonadota bacterium]MBU1452455.1 ferredoxin family protein [Pseudomonadota bacterium]MBU2467722.1 ferredoxin family protein [Pseudomonadota bacterium]MBU2518274.1 ferredoxin family protein [Pseudomonadota bacterium]